MTFAPRLIATGLLLSVASLMLLQLVGSARPAASNSGAGFYTIQFPEKGKIGEIVFVGNSTDYLGKHAPSRPNARANGLVRLPSGSHIGFRCTDVMGLQKPLVVLDAIPSDALTCLVLTNAIFDEKQLKKICRFTNLRRVEFCGTEVTDDSIGCLASLPQLEAIDVTRTRVHGRFLLDFSQSKKLKLLYMSHNEIERKYLPALKNLPNLSRLILNSVRLIDADMAIIGSCSQLEFLDIAGNAALTNKCLVDLKRLKRLHILEIPYTKLTARDLLQLKGLPLVSLRIQPGQGSTADMDALKKQFPGLQIRLETEKERDLKTYKMLFNQ